MQIVPVTNFWKIVKNKRKLEKVLGVAIDVRKREVAIDGSPSDEFVAEKVIYALDFDFPLNAALLIKEEEFYFEILNIKQHTRRHDIEGIKARIIGTKGRTLKTLGELTKCFFEIKDKEVAIIGDPENIENAQNAVISIIRGTRQSNVYAYLEKHKVKNFRGFSDLRV